MIIITPLAQTGQDGPELACKSFVRGPPDSGKSDESGQCEWHVIGATRSHWLARMCAPSRQGLTNPTLQTMARAPGLGQDRL